MHQDWKLTKFWRWWKNLLMEKQPGVCTIKFTIIILFRNRKRWVLQFWNLQCIFLYPRSPKGEEGILFYLCPSVRPSFRPSTIFFVTFFSVTVDGRNLIFGHKLHIGTPYCGKHFWPVRFLLPVCRRAGVSYVSISSQFILLVGQTDILHKNWIAYNVVSMAFIFWRK